MSNKETSILNILEDINAKIEHIEDITADNRKIIIKLVKQGNQIVSFLKSLEIEDLSDNTYNSISISDKQYTKEEESFKKLKELLDEYMEKNKDLKEFEEELEKHKDKLTPGQMGES